MPMHTMFAMLLLVGFLPIAASATVDEEPCVGGTCDAMVALQTKARVDEESRHFPPQTSSGDAGQAPVQGSMQDATAMPSGAGVGQGSLPGTMTGATGAGQGLPPMTGALPGTMTGATGAGQVNMPPVMVSPCDGMKKGDKCQDVDPFGHSSDGWCNADAHGVWCDSAYMDAPMDAPPCQGLKEGSKCHNKGDSSDGKCTTAGAGMFCAIPSVCEGKTTGSKCSEHGASGGTCEAFLDPVLNVEYGHHCKFPTGCEGKKDGDSCKLTWSMNNEKGSCFTVYEGFLDCVASPPAAPAGGSVGAGALPSAGKAGTGLPVKGLPAVQGSPPEKGFPVAQGPPVKGPSTQALPVKGPPVKDPSTQGSPPEKGFPVAQGPPVKGPSTQALPTKGPPTKGPSTQALPTKGPPAKGPPAKGPPAKGPPAGMSGSMAGSMTPPAVGPPAKGLPDGGDADDGEMDGDGVWDPLLKEHMQGGSPFSEGPTDPHHEPSWKVGQGMEKGIAVSGAPYVPPTMADGSPCVPDGTGYCVGDERAVYGDGHGGTLPPPGATLPTLLPGHTAPTFAPQNPLNVAVGGNSPPPAQADGDADKSVQVGGEGPPALGEPSLPPGQNTIPGGYSGENPFPAGQKTNPGGYPADPPLPAGQDAISGGYPVEPLPPAGQETILGH